MSQTTESTADHAPESDARACTSVSEVKVLGRTLSCLLVAPHPLYRHYTAWPGRPDQFWTWADKHPTHPCSSANCPGDARYAPPGKGHYDGCRNSPIPPASTP